MDIVKLYEIYVSYSGYIFRLNFDYIIQHWIVSMKNGVLFLCMSLYVMWNFERKIIEVMNIFVFETVINESMIDTHTQKLLGLL